MNSLVSQYRQLHAQGHFDGRSIYAYAEHIAHLVRWSQAKTLLDYGSGKGRQYIEGNVHKLWGGIMPTLYDPAWPKVAKKPRGQFDGVICVDVLEHIPEDELDETLTEIRGYARMWCFLAICCVPANKTLPDGRNVHVTVHPEEWWRDRVNAIFHPYPPVPHMRFERPGEKVKPPTLRKCPKDVYVREGWHLPPSYRKSPV